MATVGIPKLKPALILNVDDHEPSRYATTRMLQRAQFEVSEAATGAEALRKVRELKPDLVVLDVNLPDLNGIEVCRRIKADPETAGTTILHMSATFVNSGDRIRGLEGGAETYLVEPVEPEVLVATIRALLRTKDAEARMREMAAQWQSTFDAISDGVALLDAKGRILRCNHAFREIFESRSPQLVGLSCHELWDLAAIPAEGFAFSRMLRTNRRESMDVRNEGRWFQVTADPVKAADGSLSGAVYIVADITERRTLEERVRQTQKYESIGHLAAGVAHDFNNLLTAILGNTSLALAELPADSPIQERLSEVQRASERAADLTQQLLAYSGKGRFVVRPLDLNTFIRNMEDLIRAALPKKVTLVMQLDPAIPKIEADASHMQQLVTNLVLNAGEAMAGKPGKLRIAAGVQHLEADEVEDLVPGEYVTLEVQDTGCGMDERIQGQIFDPFFTTKFAGRGLGLAAVSGIVRGHRGAIQVHSAPGEGSTFRIFLPALERPAPPRVSGDLRGSGTVLVVDDEEVIRRFAYHTLRAYGYDVILASNGQEAIEVVSARGSELSAVLLDMTMPVMSGEEALERVAELRPQLKIIVSTGYAQEEAHRRFAAQHVDDFLLKPFSARQLVEKLKVVLGR